MKATSPTRDVTRIIMKGLWMTCQDGGVDFAGKEETGTTCSKYDDDTVLDYFNVSRIFMTVGTFCTCVCLVGVIFFVIRLKGLRIIAFCNVLSAVAAVSKTVCVTIQGIDYRIVQKATGFDLHASFYIGCISSLLSLLSVFFISLLLINYYSGKYEEESVDDNYISRPRYGGNYKGPPIGRQMRPQSFEYGRIHSQMPGVRY
ncbi:DgyrCDS11731 [Dimorphilus gyrociliatus]|uniref:DgyrCDS11731 n=1 Tax=Dimorphilus gyrociliatus TaxID=2664684 RepID=A0A7I8W4F1_9ANNE|nr:DgyrCDS11731 [Dimorphilus gyrociliatus]